MPNIASSKDLVLIYALTGIVPSSITLALTIWSIRTLLLGHKKQYFAKRSPLLVLLSIISSRFVVLSSTNSYCFQPFIHVFHEEHNMAFRQPILIASWLLGWIFGTFATILPTVYLIRVWLLYFDMKLSQLLKNKNWQMAINPNKISNSWFLRFT